jgi:hypothetical protein
LGEVQEIRMGDLCSNFTEMEDHDERQKVDTSSLSFHDEKDLLEAAVKVLKANIKNIEGSQDWKRIEEEYPRRSQDDAID